jgi:hypothetical protein
MLTIVRNRTWAFDATIFDTYVKDGDPGNVPTNHTGWTIRSQIRTRVGNKLVANLNVTFPVPASGTVAIRHERDFTRSLATGDYWWDIVATDAAGDDYVYVEPEPIAVRDNPTDPANSTYDFVPGGGGAVMHTHVIADVTGLQAALNGKQPLDADLTSWAGVTRAAGFDTFSTTPSSTNLRALVTDETGTGALVFATGPTFAGLTNTGALNLATGTTFVYGTGIASAHRTALGLGTGDSPTFSGLTVTGPSYFQDGGFTTVETTSLFFDAYEASNGATFTYNGTGASDHRIALGLGTTDSPTFGNATFSTGSIATSQPLTLTQTWNAAGVTFAAQVVDITTTNSANGSAFFDVKQNGISRFKVVKNSGATTAQIIINGGDANPCSFTCAGNSLSIATEGNQNVTLANGFTVRRNGGGAATTGGTITSTQTWNSIASIFTGFNINVTDSNSDPASLLMDLQVGGVSQAKFRKDGLLTCASINASSSGSNFASITSSSTGVFLQAGGRLGISNTGYLGFSASADATGALDLQILRDGAANTLAQRNGTAAQTSRFYDTYTSATDYHRLAIATARATATAMSGASVTLTNIIPAGAVVVGVTCKVTTAITGATSFQIGTAADPDRFGAAVAIALATTSDNRNWTSGTVECFPAATSLILTANGSNFTAGAVYVSVQYLSGQAD